MFRGDTAPLGPGQDRRQPGVNPCDFGDLFRSASILDDLGM